MSAITADVNVRSEHFPSEEPSQGTPRGTGGRFWAGVFKWDNRLKALVGLGIGGLFVASVAFLVTWALPVVIDQAITPRFDALEQRFDALEQRFDAVERQLDEVKEGPGRGPGRRGRGPGRRRRLAGGTGVRQGPSRPAGAVPGPQSSRNAGVAGNCELAGAGGARMRRLSYSDRRKTSTCRRASSVSRWNTSRLAKASPPCSRTASSMVPARPSWRKSMRWPSPTSRAVFHSEGVVPGVHGPASSGPMSWRRRSE